MTLRKWIEEAKDPSGVPLIRVNDAAQIGNTWRVKCPTFFTPYETMPVTLHDAPRRLFAGRIIKVYPEDGTIRVRAGRRLE